MTCHDQKNKEIQVKIKNKSEIPNQKPTTLRRQDEEERKREKKRKRHLIAQGKRGYGRKRDRKWEAKENDKTGVRGEGRRVKGENGGQRKVSEGEVYEV